MIKVAKVTFTPVEESSLPHSTGHLLFSALLDAIRKQDEELSKELHSSDSSKISVQPIRGDFKRKDGNRKTIFPDAQYRTRICFVNCNEAVEAVFNQWMLKEGSIQLGDAELKVESFEAEETSFQELVEADTPEELFFHFKSPTCIKYKDSEVTEMYPHREAVFKALLSSWNRFAPENLRFEIKTEELKKQVLEKPVSHETHNTVVTRKYVEEKGHKVPIKAFGFTGKTVYGFQDASIQLKHQLTALSRYASYVGVGGHTAQGLGNTYTELNY